MCILCCIDSLHTIVLPFITARMLLDRGMTLLVGFRIASHSGSAVDGRGDRGCHPGLPAGATALLLAVPRLAVQDCSRAPARDIGMAVHVGPSGRKQATG